MHYIGLAYGAVSQLIPLLPNSEEKHNALKVLTITTNKPLQPLLLRSNLMDEVLRGVIDKALADPAAGCRRRHDEEAFYYYD